jgi:hypothetical protein
MKKKEELDLVWELLHRAMSVIEDMTTLRPPALRIQQEIEEIQDEISEIEGRQE